MNSICIWGLYSWNKILKRRFNQLHCQGGDVNSRDAFVPPKPKELDKAALIFISFEAVKGMKASLNSGSGFDRLSVNGATPCNKTKKVLNQKERPLVRKFSSRSLMFPIICQNTSPQTVSYLLFSE